MTAFNIVRFRVKPGHEEHFIAAHRGRNLGLRGFRGGTLVKTGERSYCIVGEWTSLQKIIEARPKMIGILDTFRDEPLPESSPFYRLANCIVTPHTSWSSAEALGRTMDVFCENLRRYRAGEPLLHVVDAAQGY